MILNCKAFFNWSCSALNVRNYEEIILMEVYNLLGLKLTVALNMASGFIWWVLFHVLKLFGNWFYSATWKVHFSWLCPLIFPENVDVEVRLTELCEEVKVQFFFQVLNKQNYYKSRVC